MQYPEKVYTPGSLKVHQEVIPWPNSLWSRAAVITQALCNVLHGKRNQQFHRHDTKDACTEWIVPERIYYMILHDFCAMAGNGRVDSRQVCVILEGQADIVQEEADVLLLLKSPQLLEPLGMHEMVQRW